jgi:hypothetical protein
MSLVLLGGASFALAPPLGRVVTSSDLRCDHSCWPLYRRFDFASPTGGGMTYPRECYCAVRRMYGASLGGAPAVAASTGARAVEGPWAKAGVLFALLGIIAAYLIAAGQAHWFPFSDDVVQACAGQSIENSSDSSDRLRPPENLTITWERSPTLSGRVSAAIHWRNVDPRTSSGLIEVVGRYGSTSENDLPYVLDGRKLPREGLCGHWLRRYNRADDDERGVYFDGLWPDEQYCFSVNSSDPGGGVRSPYPSIGTPAVCESAPWDQSWGKAARPTGPVSQ